MNQTRQETRAFTLIELLVVVAIIALLISILLPSLSAARNQAKATKCAANLSSVGKAVAGYLTQNASTYPLSYYYASDDSGGYDVNRQDVNRAFGYVHWSYQLFENGKVQDEAFQCPQIPRGGHPRTNPGPDPANWVDDDSTVTDDSGATRPGGINNALVEDRQAKFMAFSANAAVMPRNKLGNVPSPGGGQRRNKFVREGEIANSGDVILAAEFNSTWRAIATQSEGGYKVKSHRPLNPFYNAASGYNEYGAPPGIGIYSYWQDANRADYNLEPLSRVDDPDINQDIEDGSRSELNSVGRHHPGGDKLGGTANFLYCDGHVARKTILQTLNDRDWGKAYYGINGNNNVSAQGWEYIPR
jgi:prepilin-type N-terminal cleavage/methylation domain-containing protein/prepilin-type processing-associated H-X9-DG protein